MRVESAIRRSGIGIEADRTVHEAASAMEKAGVGALAVLDGEELVGIVTDRDLVRRAMAQGLPSDARIDAVMSCPVFIIDAAADLHDAFAMFRDHAVRRLAVVERGRFVGMITVDDLLIELARDLTDLTRPVRREVMFADHDSPLPVTT
jgi:signal-transduction protein with cAMP-binding, CBS, and nucleotidyltransferase domain